VPHRMLLIPTETSAGRPVLLLAVPFGVLPLPFLIAFLCTFKGVGSSLVVRVRTDPFGPWADQTVLDLTSDQVVIIRLLGIWVFGQSSPQAGVRLGCAHV